MTPEIETSLDTLATKSEQYINDNKIAEPLIIGIHSGGVWIAEWLRHQLSITSPVSVLDISFYRDDFTRQGLKPQITNSDLPDDIEGRDIILIDDVVMSGRTTRAAMNELFDYGRPRRIHLFCLFDVGQRELPIQPDVIGARLTLQDNERIQVAGPDPLKVSVVSE